MRSLELANKQGLWWGGERIWLEDMIRLKKHRSELPSDALGAPSIGTADRAVLLSIRLVDEKFASLDADTGRCITIEVSPDSSSETATAWRCLLYGDVSCMAMLRGRAEFSSTADTSDCRKWRSEDGPIMLGAERLRI